MICEHCGGNRVVSYPPPVCGCPGCGAPVCCQTCCDRANLIKRVTEWKEKLRASESAARANVAGEVADSLRQQQADLALLIAFVERESQPHADNDEQAHVWLATSAYGHTCHFGERAAAAAWAGRKGKVERAELPKPPEEPREVMTAGSKVVTKTIRQYDEVIAALGIQTGYSHDQVMDRVNAYVANVGVAHAKLKQELDTAERQAHIHFQCEEEQGRMYEEMRHAVGVADGTPHEEAVKTAAALADSEVTENLVALVGRLSYALRKANPANGLPTKAMSYLEGAGFKFHAARTSEIDSRSAETPFAEAVKKLEITASGHAVGADKSGDRYQIGFARGFHACWKQFAELCATPSGEGRE